MNLKRGADQDRLLKRAIDGDTFARDKLAEDNMGLVWSVVKKFTNRGYEADDLFQIGCIGLLKAIDKFDFSYGVKFSTYAVPMIIGEIKRFLRDDGAVKVSRGVKELAAKARATSEIMQKQTGEAPTIGQLSECLGVPAEDIVFALEAACPPESLFAGEESDLAPLIERTEANLEGQNEGEIVNRLALAEVLQKLPVRERQLIVLRYFQNMTQLEVAKLLGISQVQVSRLEKKVLGLLRVELAER